MLSYECTISCEAEQQALKYYEKCRNLEVYDEKQRIEYYLLMGEIYLELNKLALSRKYYEQAASIASRYKTRYEENLAIGGLGEIYLRTGDFAQAKPAFRKPIASLNLPSQLLAKANWIHKLAEVYVGEKQFGLADKYFVLATETAQKAKDIIYSLNYQCDRAKNLLELQEYALAQSCLDIIFSSDAVPEISQVRARAFFIHGCMKRTQKNLAGAISSFKKAVDYFEQMRKRMTVSELRIGFFSEAHIASKHLAACYLDKFARHSNSADLDSALFFIELGRNRHLKEIPAVVEHHTKNDSIYAAIADKLRYKQRLWRRAKTICLQDEIVKSLYAEVELEHFALMESRLYLFQTLNDSTTTVIPDTINGLHKKFLNSYQGRILYHFVSGKIYAIVSNRKEIRAIMLPIRVAELRLTIKSLVSMFTSAPDNPHQRIIFQADRAFRLYETLILPIEKLIALPEELIIVPDGILNQLPFEMLLTQDALKNVYLPTDYPDYTDALLLQRYAVGYSSVIFPEEVQQRCDERNIVVFANPAHDINDKEPLSSRGLNVFIPLLYAIKEAKKIANVWDKTQIFIGAAGTKNQLRKVNRSVQIIHFATHAFADSIFDAFSGIIMAASQDSTDDGILMGYEIDDMDFSNCDLVFLVAAIPGRANSCPARGRLGCRAHSLAPAPAPLS